MNTTYFSPVIAGCMKWGQWGARFSTNEYLQVIEECIAMGVTTFDHADIYGHYTTEEEFGKALLQNPSLRKKMQLITKCGIRMVTPHRPEHKIKSYDTGKAHIIRSAEQSLKNFGSDYIDVLLIHRPDPLMNPGEIAEAFTLLKQQGKVLEFGVSNFTLSQFQLLHSCYPLKFHQFEISLLKLDPFTNGALDQCIAQKIIPMSWSPLGGGKLLSDSDDERGRRIMAVAEILAEKYNSTSDQILFAWLYKHPSGIIPVTGTIKTKRIKAALAAKSIEITREEWFMLWRASTGAEVP